MLLQDVTNGLITDLMSEVRQDSGDSVKSNSADAGLVAPETLSFIYQGSDELENASDTILVKNAFQIYQEDLPPLPAPEGLKAENLSEGRIKLTWNEVEEAVGYQLYRKAPGESELTPYQRLLAVLEYTDTPAQDGLYQYAVASIRQENGQEAISGMSAAVEARSDSLPPEAPTNLTLELVANGIKAEWSAPIYSEPVTFNLYRADLPEITSVEGMTPLIHSIPQTLVVDPNPSTTQHCYVATAVDAAGNESEPSNSVYRNFGLLPVSSLVVRQTDHDPPVITWTHPGGDIAGYDLYLGTRTDGIKMNASLLDKTNFTDIGYSGDQRHYTIVVVDSNSQESTPRTVTLPVIRAELVEGSLIRWGIMNRVDYELENLSESPVENARMNTMWAGGDSIFE